MQMFLGEKKHGRRSTPRSSSSSGSAPAPSTEPPNLRFEEVSEIWSGKFSRRRHQRLFDSSDHKKGVFGLVNGATMSKKSWQKAPEPAASKNRSSIISFTGADLSLATFFLTRYDTMAFPNTHLARLGVKEADFKRLKISLRDWICSGQVEESTTVSSR